MCLTFILTYKITEIKQLHTFSEFRNFFSRDQAKSPIQLY